MACVLAEFFAYVATVGQLCGHTSGPRLYAVFCATRACSHHVVTCCGWQDTPGAIVTPRSGSKATSLSPSSMKELLHKRTEEKVVDNGT